MKNKHFTDAQSKFIEKHYDKMTYVQLAVKFNNKFNADRSGHSMRNFCHRRKLKCANRINSGCFKKGITVWNKGLKGVNGVSNTTFKHGHIPKTWRPVGSERQCKRDKTIQIKIAEPSVWREKSHIEWEKHNGPLPDGYIISYLDNDHSNYEVSNLRMITRAELGYLMNADTKSMSAEHKEVMLNVAKLSVMSHSKVGDLE